MSKPLAVTMGDPAGVGPEIVLRAFAEGAVKDDFIVYGDMSVLEMAREMLGLDVEIRESSGPGDCVPGVLNVRSMGAIDRSEIAIGSISALCGALSLRYIEAATRAALDGEAAAIVTLPVNKEAVRYSSKGFTGHTEHIAAMCGQERFTMMLWSDKLVVTHVTTHIPLTEASRRITASRVHDTIMLTHDAMARVKPKPRLAVAGLNPHAGEGGAFGDEEERAIRPAVDLARREGYDVYGPVAPDTVFYSASRGAYDAVVCMYHDQGHIPFKLLDFNGGVNVTLGLSVVRTSVDHGTAYDIAYKGIADISSFVKAAALARELAGE